VYVYKRYEPLFLKASVYTCVYSLIYRVHGSKNSGFFAVCSDFNLAKKWIVEWNASALASSTNCCW